MSTAPAVARTVAEWIADFLVARGVDRVFGLQGGHIQPIWDQLGAARRAHRRRARRRRRRAHGACARGAHRRRRHRDGHRRSRRHQLRDRDGERAARARAGAADRRLRARARRTTSARCRASRTSTSCGRSRAASRTLRFADNVLRDLDKAYATAAGDGNPPGPVYVEIPDRRAAQDVSPRSSCCASTSRQAAAPHSRPIPPTSSARRALIGEAQRAAGDHRPRRDGQRRASSCASSTRTRRALSRHAGEPRPRARRASSVRRRRARPRDAGGRSRDHRRAQARLPDRLRLAGGAAQRALCCASPTTGKSCARTAAAKSSCSPHPALALDGARRRHRKRPSATLDTAWTQGAARRARAARREVRGRARRGAGRQGRPHASEPHLRRAARSARSPMPSRSPTAATS